MNPVKRPVSLREFLGPGKYTRYLISIGHVEARRERRRKLQELAGLVASLFLAGFMAWTFLGTIAEGLGR